MNSKVFDIIDKEYNRQHDTIELIASENFVSDDILKALGSCLTNKYSEGYPDRRSTEVGRHGRYYGGCQYIDELEDYCCDMWRRAFRTDYHVNVQPHSGSSANLAAYMSILNPGDKVLSMSLQNGGHLTHGSNVNFSGKLFNFSFYGVDNDGFIDYNRIEDIAKKERPKLIVAGASAYPRIINFKYFKDVADSIGALFMVDMAHIAGLVVSEDHPSPFDLADIITTTTHKTLRGARGGLIFCKPELATKIDAAVFPCCQGGPLQNVIAAKAITAEEACTTEYANYIHSVVYNSKTMSEEFTKLGYNVVTGGTDNHLFVIDFSKTHPNLTGKDVQEELDRHGITLNKNCVPNEKRSPVLTSGVRIGTAAETTKGKTANDFVEIAHTIGKLINTIS